MLGYGLAAVRRLGDGLQNHDANLYGAVYTNSKNITTFSVKEVEEESEEGKPPIRQVLVRRNNAFDNLTAGFRRNEYAIKPDEVENEAYLDEMTDYP